MQYALARLLEEKKVPIADDAVVLWKLAMFRSFSPTLVNLYGCRIGAGYEDWRVCRDSKECFDGRALQDFVTHVFL